MYTFTKILFITGFLLACGWMSRDNYQDVKFDNSLQSRQAREEIIDDNRDNVHDSTCNCGYCQEGTEILTSKY